MYQFIALLKIMNKTLKSIMIKWLNDITEIYYMLLNAQIKMK